MVKLLSLLLAAVLIGCANARPSERQRRQAYPYYPHLWNYPAAHMPLYNPFGPFNDYYPGGSLNNNLYNHRSRYPIRYNGIGAAPPHTTTDYKYRHLYSRQKRQVVSSYPFQHVNAYHNGYHYTNPSSAYTHYQGYYPHLTSGYGQHYGSATGHSLHSTNNPYHPGYSSYHPATGYTGLHHPTAGYYHAGTAAYHYPTVGTAAYHYPTTGGVAYHYPSTALASTGTHYVASRYAYHPSSYYHAGYTYGK